MCSIVHKDLPRSSQLRVDSFPYRVHHRSLHLDRDHLRLLLGFEAGKVGERMGRIGPAGRGEESGGHI